MQINVVLDTHIRLNPHDFPIEVITNIKDLLRIPNPAKSRAEKEMLWGAKSLPEYIELWEEPTSHELVLPRGHWGTVSQFAHDYELDLNWVDRTTHYEDCHKNVELISLREYQSKAIEKLAKFCGGIYSAPTGAGKSRVMLELVRTLGQKTIIICEKTDIQDQWIKFASELGFDSIGEIGNGIWDDTKDITIALRQSLSNKDLDQNWYKQFGMVVIDEVHHLCSANTLIDLVQRFSARYRFGCSATPDSDPDLFPIASAVIGPIVHSTPIKEIGDHLVIPSIKVVKTEFGFDYRPTLRLKNGRVERNNYSELTNALEKDIARNFDIMRLVLREHERGHHCLVLSKRKKHIEYLYNSYMNDNVNILTGDNSGEYNTIKNDIESSDKGFVLFSTLAEEGTDISRLDRLFLTYPGRKLRSYQQAIGRVMRPHTKKKDAVVYDFRDINVSLLNSQFRHRCQMLYNKENYKIEHIK